MTFHTAESALEPTHYYFDLGKTLEWLCVMFLAKMGWNSYTNLHEIYVSVCVYVCSANAVHLELLTITAFWIPSVDHPQCSHLPPLKKSHDSSTLDNKALNGLLFVLSMLWITINVGKRKISQLQLPVLGITMIGHSSQ